MAAGQVLASTLLFNISPDEGTSKSAVLSNIGLKAAAPCVIN
jgi:hypothetical protein